MTGQTGGPTPSNQGNTAGPGRSTRTRVLSTRAQESIESGEQIAGTSGHLAQELPVGPPQVPRAASRVTKANRKKKANESNTGHVDVDTDADADAATAFNAPNPPAAEMARTKHFPATRDTSSPAPAKPPPSKQVAAARDTPAPITAPDGTVIPSFSQTTFQIYAWPGLTAPSLDRISDSTRAWKKEQDALVPEDDGSDDWAEFAGNPDYYPEPGSRESAIARTFVHRAKRAVRDSVSWERFEASELEVDSMVAAKAETDPARKQILLEECLDNDLRLAVFEQLKGRLCNEIWLQEYTGRVAARQAAVSGASVSADSLALKGIRNLQVADGRRDSPQQGERGDVVEPKDKRPNDDESISVPKWWPRNEDDIFPDDAHPPHRQKRRRR